MAKAKIIAFHKCIGDCTITELDKDGERYFKAKILGWNNFKFTGDKLKPQELFNRVIKEVGKIKKWVEEDSDEVENLPLTYNLN